MSTTQLEAPPPAPSPAGPAAPVPWGLAALVAAVLAAHLPLLVAARAADVDAAALSVLPARADRRRRPGLPAAARLRAAHACARPGATWPLLARPGLLLAGAELLYSSWLGAAAALAALAAGLYALGGVRLLSGGAARLAAALARRPASVRTRPAVDPVAAIADRPLGLRGAGLPWALPRHGRQRGRGRRPAPVRRRGVQRRQFPVLGAGLHPVLRVAGASPARPRHPAAGGCRGLGAGGQRRPRGRNRLPSCPLWDRPFRRVAHETLGAAPVRRGAGPRLEHGPAAALPVGAFRRRSRRPAAAARRRDRSTAASSVRFALPAAVRGLALRRRLFVLLAGSLWPLRRGRVPRRRGQAARCSAVVERLDADSLPAQFERWQRRATLRRPGTPEAPSGSRRRPGRIRPGRIRPPCPWTTPFPAWHDLTRCYTGQGWTMDEQAIHKTDGAAPTITWSLSSPSPTIARATCCSASSTRKGRRWNRVWAPPTSPCTGRRRPCIGGCTAYRAIRRPLAPTPPAPSTNSSCSWKAIRL